MVFVGRSEELATLEELWGKDSFQMVVIYGRRRVGKTTLISEFSRGKRTLSFTALEQSDQNNLSDFSRKVQEFFDLPQTGSFLSWQEAISYVGEQALKEPFIFVFDEFPYAAQRNESLTSVFQITIDHIFNNSKALIILCGSNQGAMESKVLGRKSPLYGRRTAQIKMAPLSFNDAAKMIPASNSTEIFEYYACFGGVPYYLDQIDGKLSFRENIAKLYFRPSGFLYGEPLGLLRQEVSEPALYNSILRAIAKGANRQSEIADRVGVQATTLSRYLANLVSLGIIERVVPFGESSDKSKHSLYRISDACFDFWFKFVMPYSQEIEAGLGGVVADSIEDSELNDYFGRRFERVCCEWLIRQAKEALLPFPALSVSSWWGNDPIKKEETDIDVLAANKRKKQLAIGECKYRNNFNETQVVETLLAKEGLIAGYHAKWFYLFSKKVVSQKTKERYGETVQFISTADIFQP